MDAAAKAAQEEARKKAEEARVRLGGLFRSEDYPAPEELRSKFSFETKVMPGRMLATSESHWAMKRKERIKRQMTAAVEASLQVASRDPG